MLKETEQSSEMKIEHCSVDWVSNISRLLSPQWWHLHLQILEDSASWLH
jgi:hypothetical protein